MNSEPSELNRLVDVDHLLTSLSIMLKQSLNDFPTEKEEQELSAKLLEVKRRQAIVAKYILGAIKKETEIKFPDMDTYQKINLLLVEVNDRKKRDLRKDQLIALTSGALDAVAEFMT